MNQFQITDKASLEEFITSNWNRINEYIDSKMNGLPVPIYSSVDIRESKNKFAPVDHNMYPAGFNNLCQLDLDASARVFEKALKRIDEKAQKIAIIPESNTKNLFYLDHLAFLGKALMDAGYEVSYVSLDANLFEGDTKELPLISHSKFDVLVHRGEILDGELTTSEGTYCLAILNNDQSSPLDIKWDEVKTAIHPTPLIGWFQRQKVKHFTYYSQVVDAFSKEFSVCPKLLHAQFRNEDDVDFSSKEGLERLASEVDGLLSELAPDTKVFVKASQGTYGMGISVVSSGEEVIAMNRKTRNKMDIGKNKIKFTSLIIQEGIESIVQYDGMPAEVAIYLVDGKPVGGFVRANSQKGAKENLNSRGMVFRKYCISEIRENNDAQAKEAVYSVLARLSTLASAYEIKEVMN